ncbi:stage V sporulation protein AD [Niallia circulans]|uniref:stage V sporulation protein AD n=1 Tax=Shouchella clausii TaxID=79880 RepID=UPI000BA68E43|nr:stage V sporulation protein AD [Shouchella clausii]SPU21839.1 stage V sporulation protein AD [Niallia circulans]MBU8597174.1 stage V sporulation protein AD [Shouchella clausii]MCM3547771.1 stage V sporulation protein AD [Shouchella clausii]MCY1104367.1 stage V sporulation protein AD [Shouchella clausii]MED4160357.1 stage V sporulation protein AD [Shouchella clausii]
MGLSHRTMTFSNPVYIQSSGTAVGPKEGAGPLAGSFDYRYTDIYCNEKSWEMAERALMKQAIKQCLTKNHLSIDSVDLFVAGDLSNQTTASSFVARDLQLPYIGTYSACATSVETLIISGVWVSSGLADLVLAAASSHYGACEKQFRYPTEFAVQKPETAQTTVTGAGAVLLGKKRTQIQLTEATIGRVQDLGITDPMSLGAAMAPAAAEVTIGHLHKTNQQVSDFDLIVTGDLAISGSEIYRKLLREQGIYITGRYEDCGVMMYHSKQQALAGGSGAGCSASVVYGHIYHRLLAGELKRVLVVATGALLSSMTVLQKQSIPAIAHAIVLERRN